MSDKDKLDAQIREKAEELLYRKKIEELSNNVAEVIRDLPKSLSELRRSLELLDSQNEKEFNISKAKVDSISTEIKSLQREFSDINDELSGVNETLNIVITSQSEISNNTANLRTKLKSETVLNKLEAIEKGMHYQISDKNNSNSVNSLILKEFDNQNDILSDLNNEKSLVSQINKQTKTIMNSLDSKNSFKTAITWILASIGSIVTILVKLGVI